MNQKMKKNKTVSKFLNFFTLTLIIMGIMIITFTSSGMSKNIIHKTFVSVKPLVLLCVTFAIVKLLQKRYISFLGIIIPLGLFYYNSYEIIQDLSTGFYLNYNEYQATYFIESFLSDLKFNMLLLVVGLIFIELINYIFIYKKSRNNAPRNLYNTNYYTYSSSNYYDDDYYYCFYEDPYYRYSIYNYYAHSPNTKPNKYNDIIDPFNPYSNYDSYDSHSSYDSYDSYDNNYNSYDSYYIYDNYDDDNPYIN